MSEATHVEIELDDHCYLALQGHAERLGLDIAEVVDRAVAAWIADMSEGCAPSAAITGRAAGA